MLYIDAPYGLRYAGWDHKAFDSPDYIRIFKQMEAMTERDNWIAVVWTDRYHLNAVSDAMKDRAFRSEYDLVWYKFNQNQEGNQSLTRSVEYGTVGFKDGRTNVPWYMSANPTERHNVAVGGTMRRLHKRANGQPVNPYQKPPYLARHICKCWLAPGSTVVVGGVGAGGDVEGLISAGMHVVGFENDLEQCKELISIWNRYESDYKEKQVFGWAEHEPVGTFGGMHFDTKSNITNYKTFLNSREEEEEKIREGEERRPERSQEREVEEVPMCALCGKGLEEMDRRTCHSCQVPVCNKCWDQTCLEFMLPQGTPVFCEEKHRPVEVLVPDSQNSVQGTQQPSQSQK